jgi:hypothetical protein
VRRALPGDRVRTNAAASAEFKARQAIEEVDFIRPCRN